MSTVSLSNHQDRLGVLVCGHGSRNRLALEEFEHLCLKLRSRFEGIPLEYGFLEFARPTLTNALDQLKSNSVNKVIAVPAMLFAAGHAKNDIPSLLNKYSRENQIDIQYGRELGVNNYMINAASERIKETIRLAPKVSLSDTLLAVIGRGSSDPDANSNVSKITRVLVEGFGFGWGETLYSGVTFPLVEPGLRHIVRLGFKRIIVFPYFLFSGVLVSRIKHHSQKVSEEYPDIEFLNAGYLSDQSFVIDTFEERIFEVINGNPAMNCSLCKYRSNLIGFEPEVGLAQKSHHHHVEGLTESCSLCDRECTGLCQESENLSLNVDQANHSHHDHFHHYPYPHSDHPLGPRTLKKNDDENERN